METITVTHSTAAILEVLRGQMKMVNSVVRRNLGGITHEESLTAPGTGGNCCNWVLGHLVNSNEQMLEMLGQPAVLEEETLRRYRRGSPELHDRAEALPLEKLLAAWEESCVRIDAGLGSMSQERFDAPAPFSPRNKADETIGSLLTVIVFHQAYHAGQLGVLRRVTGKEGAIK
jgi:uncharacterized damage-inducible protein DinB